jgi:HK97 family phage portal protein
MSAMVFRQTLQAHALLDGNGMAYIARDGSGRPTELIPLLPGRASPIRVNGELWYYTMISSITGETAPAENVTVRYLDASSVLHIRGLGFNGLTGYPLYQYARNSMGLGLAAQQYASTFFSNGAAPSVVFEHPGKMSDKAKLGLSEAWKSRHEGLGKQHRTAILEEGMKLHAFGVDPDKSQLLELRQHQIREMANWLGLPPHKLGDTTRTAYASLEQENQAYLDDALDPWLVKWEEECREKLLTEQEKNTDSHVIEFMRQALVRANLAARAQFYNLAIQGGWMNRDEVRARENMNAIPNGAGAEFLRPLNMTPASAEPAEPTEPDEIPVAKPTRKRKAKVTP